MTVAVTSYELLLFLHVLAAAFWVGAVAFTVVLAEAALRSDDRTLVLRLAAYDDRMAPLYFIPAVIAVLGAGIGLVLDGPWSFGDGWVVAGLILLAAVFALGLGLIVPASKRLTAAVEEGGVDSAGAQSALQRVRLLGWLDLALLVAAVFVMTVKPF